MKEGLLQHGADATAPPITSRDGAFARMLSAARRALRRIASATTGLALLWVGWLIIVFFVALWFMAADAEHGTREWQALVLMAMLGQCAIMTGIGMAIIDIVWCGEGRFVGRLHRPFARRALSPNGQDGLHDIQIAAEKSQPIVNGRPGGRAAVLLPDGSIVVQTKLGDRRFTSTQDAIEFVGVGLANAPIASSDIRH